MAFLGVDEIEALQKTDGIIDPFEKERIKNAAYELSLGGEVYLTDSKTKKVEYLNNTNRQVLINPGQFALLLTKEIVYVPNDKLAFISIKAGEKLKGLVNVSGFHVDPGFKDHLLFSVYNAGPSIIILNINEPCFLIWFAELSSKLKADEAYSKKNEHYKKFDHIPAKYIEFLKRGDLASPNVLLERIKTSESKTSNLQWAAGILIGLGITLSAKSCWDYSKFNEGRDVGLKEQRSVKTVDSLVKKVNIDSIVRFKVDSILKIRIHSISEKHGNN
jgi:dCTP deaminase